MSIFIFCDFDGTITNIDVIDAISYKIIGAKKTDEINEKISSGELTIRDYLEVLSGINDVEFTRILFETITENKISIDPTFTSFITWCNENNIKLYILSYGFKKIISHFLPQFNRNNIFAHDLNNTKIIYDHTIIPKCEVLNKHELFDTQPDYTIHIGDGNSDYSMINKCDILFAKKDSSLEKKCIELNAQFYSFNNFNDVKETLITKLQWSSQ